MTLDPWQAFCAALVNDIALSRLLLDSPLAIPGLEKRMTERRRDFLMTGAPGEARPILSHLARQCFINEYAWAQDGAETAQVEALKAEIVSGQRQDPAGLLTLACYMPLSRLPDAETLPTRAWPELVSVVLKQQVADARLERSLAATAPSLTPIRAGVSAAVRAQYEDNPYPRWVKQNPPHSPGSAEIDILIAGCGTGRTAIGQARGNPAARVLAVDLSQASLGYAMRMARELGVENLSFAQADVLELGRLERRFEMIECAGVLHHLDDPFEGAAVLAGLLKPGGTLIFSVYSATARRLLAPAQAFARAFPPTAEGIRALRQAVASSAPDGPIHFAAGSPDFASASGCRDLLMHAHELQMEIADIRRMVEENGLQFRGFMVQPDVRARYQTEHPQDPAALDFDGWAAFEQRHPATFASMYQVMARRPN